jgi:preprotein translocase subunit SecE
MNRQVKRQMARQGADKARAPERRPAPAPTKERVGPRAYLREVQGELRKVAWPTRSEVVNASIVVIVGIVVMSAIIFGFDYSSLKIVDFIFG